MYKGGRQTSELENRGERRRQRVNTEDGCRQGRALQPRREGMKAAEGQSRGHPHLSPVSAAGGLFLRSSENSH